MPDWVIHLGSTYGAAQAASRLNPKIARWLAIRHLLIGTILPDVTRFTIILVDVLDWPAVQTFTYFIPFHSLLLVGVFAGAIALVLPAPSGGSRHAFLLLMIGAAFHFLLDDFDGLIGCGTTTFYPFYFGRPFSGWDNNGYIVTAWLIAAAMILGVALTRRHSWASLSWQLTPKRLAGAGGLVLVALITPLFFQTRMIEGNAYYLRFVLDPTAFEGQTVELCFSEIIATDPLTVEEFDVAFQLHLPPVYEQGEWLSVRGIYRAGAIEPTLVVRQRSFAEAIVSAVAAVALFFLLFDERDLNRLIHWLRHRMRMSRR